MRYCITVSIILIAFSNIKAQWEIINQGLQGYTNTVDFVNETGWVAGTDGMLVKTTDSGESWNSVLISEAIHFDNIDFLTESLGWAIARPTGLTPDSSIFLKTSDGGLSWSAKLRYQLNAFTNLCVVDQNCAFFAGTDKIFKTTDGGNTFADISPDLLRTGYYSIFFTDSLHGIVAGSVVVGFTSKGLVLKTTDGGKTWTEKIFDEFESINDLKFSDKKIYFRAGSYSNSFLCKSTDTCNTWSKLYQGFVYSYKFFNNDIAYSLIRDSLGININKSTDGGITWNNINSPDKISNIYKIHFTEPGRGIVIEDFTSLSDNRSTTIYSTSDDGYSWNLQKLTYPLNYIFFSDKDKGILSGGFIIPGMHSTYMEGKIFVTNNGGQDWEPVALNKNASYKAFSFPFTNTGFSLVQVNRNRLRVIKSSDSGIKWNSIYSDSGLIRDGRDIFAPDSERILVVAVYADSGNGYRSVISGTTDGGLNWKTEWVDTLSSEYTSGLHSVYSTSNAAWAVGEKLILKNIMQNGWENLPCPTDLPLTNVFSIDDKVVWISGGYQDYNSFETVFLKTINGGQSWDIKENIPYFINDMFFNDAQNGLAVGNDRMNNGVILKTSDGGNNWSIAAGNSPGPLKTLYVKDKYAWAAGRYGLVLNTTNAGLTWVDQQNDNVYPSEYYLEQNYPNPFNPETKIKWLLPHGSQVTLKIFNPLGEEIETVIDEFQEPGIHSVIFHSKSLSSGVYFYRLSADSYVGTKKMVILQ